MALRENLQLTTNDLQHSKLLPFLCLLGILAIAAFFRLWQLAQVPPGLYPDVAINGNDALETLKTGNFKLFYPENNGREGLFIWLIAASFSIFGVSIWSIKIVAAIIGILTVLGLYLLAKELFEIVNSQWLKVNSQSIALLSSFFLATSFWHVNFSRIGFRAILIPFILVFAFYFLVKGLKNKTALSLIISGIFFGLGFYTYISYRFIVLLLPLILIFWFFIYQKENLQKIFIINTLFLLVTIFIIGLPIGLYFLQNPQDFIGRAAQTSIFATENPIKEFGKSLILHLGMFNFYGDPNWRHNFSGSPMLPWPIGILFLIGIFISAREILRKSNYQNKNFQPLSAFYFLFSTFFIMLLPGILTYEGIPHSLRTIGVIPSVFIFLAIGGAALWAKIKPGSRFLTGFSFRKPNVAKRVKNSLLGKEKIKKVWLLNLILAIFFGYLITAQYQKYFISWAKNPNVNDAFSADLVKIGEYLNSLRPKTQKYVIVNLSGAPVPRPNGIPMPAQTIMFIENMKYGSPQSTYLLPENLSQIKIEREVVILPMNPDNGLFEKLSQMFPEGEKKEEQGIWIYEINPKF